MSTIGGARPADGAPVLDVVVPVYNEERDLGPSIRRLHAHLVSFPFSSVITIADNASRDGTLAVAQGLASELPGVRVLHLDAKGRGRALRAAWLASEAEVVAYMDVDLSTDLKALLPLVAPIVSGHSDIAIGSRLARGARTARARLVLFGRFRRDAVQQRQSPGRGDTGARRRVDHGIAAAPQQRNRRPLERRGCRVAGLGRRTGELGTQPQVPEGLGHPCPLPIAAGPLASRGAEYTRNLVGCPA